MKKFCISSAIILIIFLSAAALYKTEDVHVDNSEYLRIHIRANSNDEIDQSIKMEVKDLVVDYMTTIVLNSQTKDELVENLNSAIPSINGLIDGFLLQKGFNYKAQTQINNEFFPTRFYDRLTLQEGYYDAVIINLGSGKGDNWWCVVYPPLCFTEQRNVTYRSLIVDYINRFFDRS